MPRYAVLQPGARHHYAVPAVLADAACLAAFYTDIHAEHRPLQALARWLPSRLRPRPLERLLSRRLPQELPRNLVHDQPLAMLCRRDSAAPLLQRALRERFAGAEAVYTNFVHNDLDALRQAKAWGLKVVHEQFLDPAAGLLLLDEQRRYPGIERRGPGKDSVARDLSRTLEKWSLCDRVLVPSAACLESAVALGCDRARLRIVPYGVPEQWLALEPDPQPGRLLMVGQVGLRKGSHVLAAACRLLQAKGLRFECRVVGPQLVNVNDYHFVGPTYLGAVPRNQVQQEFRRADLFVLPTLAEGMALSALEAMASGLPVITTPQCGSVIRDGIEGFLVPIRDAEALADRIEQLLVDKSLRNSLAAAARQRAQEYSWARYGERLLAVLGAIGA